MEIYLRTDANSYGPGSIVLLALVVFLAVSCINANNVAFLNVNKLLILIG